MISQNNNLGKRKMFVDRSVRTVTSGSSKMFVDASVVAWCRSPVYKHVRTERSSMANSMNEDLRNGTYFRGAQI